MSDGYRHRYQLPDSLGGGQFTGVETDGVVIVDIPGTGLLPVPAAMLTRLIPNEPDDQAWVTIARADVWPQDVYSRHDTAALSSGQPAEFRWWWHDEKRWVPWDAVYRRGAPVRLVRSWTHGGMVAAAQRGICSSCKKPNPIRLDGMIKQHGHRHSGCPGGGKAPFEG